MRSQDIDQLAGELRRASAGSDEEYAAVLERALAACASDPVVADELDELDLHSDLADVYDRTGRVEDALAQVDVLVERGYRCAPDPRCRRAEILMRHGRVSEAAPIWAEVLRDCPDDVWVFNNAGLEYGAIGEHEVALDWLTHGLELALRTGDPERLVPQLRRLRAESLGALGREPDELQLAEPVGRPQPPPGFRPCLRRQRCRARPSTAAATRTSPTPGCRRRSSPASSSVGRTSRQRTPSVRQRSAGRSRRVLPKARTDAARGGRRRRAAASRRDVASRGVRRLGRQRPDATARTRRRLRAGYAAELNRGRADVVGWPPGRNERCWCGSGTKYKKCCAAPVRAMRTVRLQATMREVVPRVTRTVDVPEAITLDELHDVLQVALGWTDSHLHRFDTGTVRYSYPFEDWEGGEVDERGVRLSALPPRFTYVYDFGDDWHHDIEVLGTGGAEPGCVDGRASARPRTAAGRTGTQSC